LIVTFNRKGRVLVETGYNLVGGLPIGGGTGFVSVSDENNNLSGIGFNGGYLISQNFALKLSYSSLSDGNSTISSIGVGGKYYIKGKVPIDFNLGNLSSGGNGAGFGSFSVGYGFRLADNINLEPSLGYFGDSDDGLGTFNLNFSMFNNLYQWSI